MKIRLKNMQKGREIQDNIFDSSKDFRGFGDFGFHRSMMPSLFGGRDPFDDPFFTQPFHSMFGSSSASGTMQKPSKEKGIVIEELGSDDEECNDFLETGDKEDVVEPSVEHPDDDVNGNIVIYCLYFWFHLSRI